MTETRSRPDSILLIYLFRGLGDGLLLAPVVSGILNVHPGIRVGLLLRTTPFRLWPLIDLPVTLHHFPDILVDREYINLHEPLGPPLRHDAAERNRVERQLRAELAAGHYGVAADLTLKSGVDSRAWLAAVNASMRLGWYRADKVDLDHATLDVRHACDRHWTQYCVLPLVPVGVSSPRYDIRLRMAQVTTPSTQRVILVPGASVEEHRHSSELFVAVGRGIVARGESVTVIGSPAERPLVESVAAGIGENAEMYYGESFETLIALLSSSKAVVTNDTGPMHLAFALRIPTIALFANMSPIVWGPQPPEGPFRIFGGSGVPTAETILRDLAELTC